MSVTLQIQFVQKFISTILGPGKVDETLWSDSVFSKHGHDEPEFFFDNYILGIFLS